LNTSPKKKKGIEISKIIDMKESKSASMVRPDET